jgi:hypothetical protein
MDQTHTYNQNNGKHKLIIEWTDADTVSALDIIGRAGQIDDLTRALRGYVDHFEQFAPVYNALVRELVRTNLISEYQ